MKTIHFRIDYILTSEERLRVVYSVDGSRSETVELHSEDGRTQQASIRITPFAQHIRHAYQVTDIHGTPIRSEKNDWRIFYFDHRSEVVFADAWGDHPLPVFYHRSAFERCLMLPRGGESLHLDRKSSPCLLLLHTCQPPEGLVWAVTGEGRAWGDWSPRTARPLVRTGTYEWALSLTRSDFERGTNYKYLLVDPLRPDEIIWEDGGNRRLEVKDASPSSSIIRQDEMPHIKIAHRKAAGVVIPVFSLRSEGSFGIGDLGDLALFIRWAADTGLKAVQLLPINDTTRDGLRGDSYPYNGISVYALHPLYINAREWRRSEAFKRYETEASALNKLPTVDYEAVHRLKMAFLHDLYQEIGFTVVGSSDYKLFIKKESYWLDAYAAFCSCRDHFKTANFRAWPRKADTDEIAIPDCSKKDEFYKFVQFLLDRQMRKVHTTAGELGVLLKGDIPIGISPDSVPAWKDGQLFRFDGGAGAPPDAFARHGQNWGFPTYNWEEMSKDGYSWWRKRLAHMERYFDAYRIDHVLGFFRIWEIPSRHIYGVLGRFRPALPYTVEELAEYGFTNSPSAFSRPVVTPSRYASLCALAQRKEETELLNKLFTITEDGGYELKSEYDSQRRLKEMFGRSPLTEELMEVVTEVLFIADPEQSNHYHPRIGGRETTRYSLLTPREQYAYDRLHDDFFYRRHETFWAEDAMKRLPVVTQSYDQESTSLRLYPLNGDGMLPCAEDLGMVPGSVKGVLRRLEILSLEIQRMPKTYGLRFDDPSHNPYLSVATIATHDMPPLRLWWKEDIKQTNAFWHEALGHEGKAPDEADSKICEEVVSRHLESPSMLCLLSLQDLLAISPELRSKHPEEEQINVPANPNQYWQYRMHLTIEELIRATAFNEKLRGLIQKFRR